MASLDLHRWKDEDLRSPEDLLLLEYCREVGGLIYSEVTVGSSLKDPWPAGSKTRRLDGLRILSEGNPQPELISYTSGSEEEFAELVRGAQVEVIEVKRKLNRPVIGQVIAGADMFSMQYEPAEVRMVAVCEIGDPALEKVCAERGIEVWLGSGVDGG